MGRNIGRHAHGDAAGAIDQQVRKPRRQNLWLGNRLVVIRLEIDRFPIDIFQQFFCRAVQPDLGIAHRRGTIAVHRAEIALTVHQHETHGEILRHAHHRVVNRGVAMRMVLTHDFTDHTRRFAVGPVPVVTALLHHIEDAAMHRLQPVPNVRQGTTHDYAHRVVEIRGLHFVLDRDWRYVVFRRRGGVSRHKFPRSGSKKSTFPRRIFPNMPLYQNGQNQTTGTAPTNGPISKRFQ